MIAMNPQTLQLASQAATTLIRLVPKSKLAQLGLTRGPLMAGAPLAVAALSGVALAALAIPQSRQWIFAKTGELLEVGRQIIEENSKSSSANGECSSEGADSNVRQVAVNDVSG